jgi:hypothetical protein
MPEIAPPIAMEIPEVGPTSPGGGLHEEGDPGTGEMWPSSLKPETKRNKRPRRPLRNFNVSHASHPAICLSFLLVANSEKL